MNMPGLLPDALTKYISYDYFCVWHSYEMTEIPDEADAISSKKFESNKLNMYGRGQPI